jgi:hypothetical protein
MSEKMKLVVFVMGLGDWFLVYEHRHGQLVRFLIDVVVYGALIAGLVCIILLLWHGYTTRRRGLNENR